MTARVDDALIPAKAGPKGVDQTPGIPFSRHDRSAQEADHLSGLTRTTQISERAARLIKHARDNCARRRQPRDGPAAQIRAGDYRCKSWGPCSLRRLRRD